MNSSTIKIEDARHEFMRAGGILRTSEALRRGIHPRTLYAMRDQALLERLERGLYRLSELPALSAPDLTTVSRKIPKGVICLISALSFHEITTQIPHFVHIAIERGSTRPKLEYPPVRTYWFKGEAFTEGIEHHTLDGIDLQVYCVEKTLADCFKYRNKIGMDTVLEALSLYRESKRRKPRVLIRYAKVCRVEKIMRPYLEV